MPYHDPEPQLWEVIINSYVTARAVVDVMERDMATTIATKADLQLLRTELHQECALIRKDMEIMSNRIDNRIDGLSTTMTVRLGSARC
jgi:hypothetical protein